MCVYVCVLSFKLVVLFINMHTHMYAHMHTHMHTGMNTPPSPHMVSFFLHVKVLFLLTLEA